MKTRVRVPGACGELWQGTLDGKQPALITCPIDWHSTAKIEMLPQANDWVAGPSFDKAIKALQLSPNILPYSLRGGVISIESTIPLSKGMGSSTADISATIYAAVKACGQDVSPQQVAQIAIMVEPSDGLMFPGLALFNHRGGEVYENLGPAPPMGIIVLGFEGEVDTLAYNADYQAEKLKEMVIDHQEALSAIRRGLEFNNLEDVGYGATLSARAHQRILYKPQLETVIRLADWVGALGVCIAHSGTVIGVLFDTDTTTLSLKGAAAFLETSLDGLEFISINCMVGGGPRYEDRQ